jgi:membrane-bound lytic murein transglycosylase D
MIKRKLIYIFTGAAIGIALMVMAFTAGDIRNPDKEYNALFTRNTKIFVPDAPDKASFCGEEVPLDTYFVKEAFEREIMSATFMHSSTVTMFKRAYRWFPVIEPILKKNGIPDEFKFLAVAESNLGNVVSPSGAEGFWQFIKPTGLHYGLEINADVDERYNLVKATEAACRYFKDAYSTFKSWTLVAASYNRGMDGIAKALQKQMVSGYYDLYLNDETSRYVFRIIAYKEVYDHPVKYGFYLREQDFYPPIPTRIVAIDSAIPSLPAFAQKMKISYRILRELNPWIQSYTLPNKTKKIYTFLIPKEGATSYDVLMKKFLPRNLFFHDTLTINEIH